MVEEAPYVSSCCVQRHEVRLLFIDENAATVHLAQNMKKGMKNRVFPCLVASRRRIKMNLNAKKKDHSQAFCCIIQYS